MARPENLDRTQMSPFALWMIRRLDALGHDLKWLSDQGVVSLSHIHRIAKSYLPAYRFYQRPSYQMTIKIGQALGDVTGALRAADYPLSAYEGPTDNTVNALTTFRLADMDAGGDVQRDGGDIPPELVEALGYASELGNEDQRALFRMFRNQSQMMAEMTRRKKDLQAAVAEQEARLLKDK